MALLVKYFGQLADITGKSKEELPYAVDIDEFKAKLLLSYPPLAKQSFLITCNARIVQTNCTLNNGDEMALLPPFSGG